MREGAQAMSEKKRRWFQFHLSTAIVMMLVSGGLYWANTINLNPGVPCGGQRGWPFAYSLEGPGGFDDAGTFNSIAPEWLAAYIPIALDALAAIFILVLIARFAAWLKGTHAAKRRRPQLHLSTAVVMMCAAGSLMWLNAHSWETQNYDTSQGYAVNITTHGWPNPCVDISRFNGQTQFRWNGLNVSSNAFVSLVLLYASMSFCEWRIRCREVRKP